MRAPEPLPEQARFIEGEAAAHSHHPRKSEYNHCPACINHKTY